MIIRAAISLALVWMCLPHHPDLGLPQPACDQPCALSAPSPARDSILQRLHDVRDELRAGKTAIRTAQQISLPVWPSARR